MWYAKNTGDYNLGDYQADANGEEIFMLLGNMNYSFTAICAVLGNIYRECGYNPWQWETGFRTTTDYHSFSGGYGLIQWTPCWEYIDSSVAQSYSAYSPNFRDRPGTPQDGEAQILFMNYQIINGEWRTNPVGGGQYNAYLRELSAIGIDYTRFYNMTPTQFITGSGPNPNITYTRDDWLGAFATNYLRPTSWILARDFYKMSDAYNYWYEYFSGQPPTPDPPIPPEYKPHKMPLWMMINYNK